MLQEILAFLASIPDKLKSLAFPIFGCTSVMLFYWDWGVSFVNIGESQGHIKLTVIVFWLLSGFSLLRDSYLKLKNWIIPAFKRWRKSIATQKLLEQKIIEIDQLDEWEKPVAFECLSDRKQIFHAGYYDETARSLCHKRLAFRIGEIYSFEDDIWQYMMDNRQKLLDSLSEQGVQKRPQRRRYY